MPDTVPAVMAFADAGIRERERVAAVPKPCNGMRKATLTAMAEAA